MVQDMASDWSGRRSSLTSPIRNVQDEDAFLLLSPPSSSTRPSYHAPRHGGHCQSPEGGATCG
jgi:hypothetical protein